MLLRKLKNIRDLFTTIRVGFFLAIRDIKRANLWTTALIVMVMVLTFLNLIVVSGILVGLIQGIEDAYTNHYTANVFLSTPTDKQYIEHSQEILSFVRSLPEVSVYSARYTKGIRVEANYRDRKSENDIIDSTGAVLVGFDPVAENKLGNLSKFVIAGNYLQPDDYDQVLVGANLLYNYLQIESADTPTLKNVDVGSKIRLVINGVRREVTIKGVLKSKLGEIDQRVFMNQSEMKTLVGRFDNNVNEISIRLTHGSSPENIRDVIKNSGASEYAKVQTSQEGEPKFVQDIKSTFGVLGNLIGSVGLAVASITIFIVIFVNAITRRRYIGILKGIGIDSFAIEISYIIQSLFYAILGMAIGSAIVFGFLQPYIAAHPINFPFSDGVLVATFAGTMIRAGILFFATIIAGYIPARIVVNQNTLNAILGR